MAKLIHQPEINITSSHPRAPAVIWYQDRFVSASDFGSGKTRKLLHDYKFSEGSIDHILRARTLSKLSHGYTKVALRRTGDRYFDHTTGVALILILELGERNSDVLAAANDHDIMEDVLIFPREMKNLMIVAIGQESFSLVCALTNPEETGNTERDIIIKHLHYEKIGERRGSVAIKIADRCYNLRTLEIMIFPEDKITEKHLENAEKQIRETYTLIFHIARKYSTEEHPYEKVLLRDIRKVEKRISEVQTMFLKEDTKEQIKNTLDIAS